MVSLKNGILKVSYEGNERSKLFFDLCFVVNLVSIFVFYDVKRVATVTGLLTLVAAVFIWVDRRERKIVIPYNSVWFLIFIMYNGLSCFWSSYLSYDIMKLVFKMLVVLAITTAITIYVETPEDLERLMSLFVFSMVIITALELSSMPVSKWFSGNFGSNFSSFNSNEIAFWMVCAEMMSFYKAYVKGKTEYYILVIVFLIVVIVSSSRKSTVSAIVAPLVMMLLTTRKKYKAFQILLMLLAMVTVIYLIMTDDHLYSVIGRRFNSMMNYFSEDTLKTDSSISKRNSYITVAQDMFRQSPIFGKGMANFAKLIDWDYGMKKVYSHNNYWQILSELGIVGFVLYYSFYVFVIIKLIKNFFVNKSRIAIMYLTFMAMLLVLEWGIVTEYTKTTQIILAFAFTATYVGESDGRKYSYIENNINELEE